ncbi:MAG: SMP-30/gluconolactonase/LRE family protein, partial [Deltaproteobacteria bacterium]
MLRKVLVALLIILLLIVLYFLVWPVPIEPVAWKAPPNPGYTGPFAQNELLKAIEFLKIGTNHGPEDLAVDDQGRIYLSTHKGFIVRLQPDGAKSENWVNTNGRPLGIDFDNAGNLIVADAFRG